MKFGLTSKDVCLLVCLFGCLLACFVYLVKLVELLDHLHILSLQSLQYKHINITYTAMIVDQEATPVHSNDSGPRGYPSTRYQHNVHSNDSGPRGYPSNKGII